MAMFLLFLFILDLQFQLFNLLYQIAILQLSFLNHLLNLLMVLSIRIISLLLFFDQLPLQLLINLEDIRIIIHVFQYLVLTHVHPRFQNTDFFLDVLLFSDKFFVVSEQMISSFLDFSELMFMQRIDHIMVFFFHFMDELLFP